MFFRYPLVPWKSSVFYFGVSFAIRVLVFVVRVRLITSTSNDHDFPATFFTACMIS